MSVRVTLKEINDEKRRGINRSGSRMTAEELIVTPNSVFSSSPIVIKRSVIRDTLGKARIKRG